MQMAQFLPTRQSRSTIIGQLPHNYLRLCWLGVGRSPHEALGTMMAFCTTDSTRADDVDAFQHLMIRLMSLLHCSALQQLASLQEVIGKLYEIHGLYLFNLFKWVK